MFYVGWGARLLADLFLPNDNILRSMTTGTVIFFGGWAAGSFVIGIYLLISLNVFGRHSEEAFSGLRIEDFKHFLRLHIDRTGVLTIWPIKIERVPRRWRDRTEADDTPSRVVPDDPLVPELIEPAIRLK
jgi:hypothetical protein